MRTSPQTSSLRRRPPPRSRDDAEGGLGGVSLAKVAKIGDRTSWPQQATQKTRIFRDHRLEGASTSLGGGVESGSLTEFYGGTGIDEMGGGDGRRARAIHATPSRPP